MAPLEAINIENSILGSIILDNTLAYKLDELSKDMFSVSYNKEIFKIMKNLYKNIYGDGGFLEISRPCIESRAV